MTLFEFWRCTHGRRWHQNPDLDHTGDVTHGHSARVALMALHLWPGDKALAAACVVHDAGEWATGDIPYDAKQKSPMFKAMSEKMEHAAIDVMGLEGHDITDPRVKLLDRLDTYLWNATKTPWLLRTPEWIAAAVDIRGMCVTMGAGVAQAVNDAVTEAHRRAGV